MKFAPIVFSILISGTISHSAYAGLKPNLNIEALNLQVEKCFEATQHIEHSNHSTKSLASLTASCNKVLANTFKPARIEADAHFNRGVIHFYTNQYDAAISDFEQALRINPDLYQANIALGEIAVKQQNLVQALSYFDTAMEGDNQNTQLQTKRDWVASQLQLTASARTPQNGKTE